MVHWSFMDIWVLPVLIKALLTKELIQVEAFMMARILYWAKCNCLKLNFWWINFFFWDLTSNAYGRFLLIIEEFCMVLCRFLIKHWQLSNPPFPYFPTYHIHASPIFSTIIDAKRLHIWIINLGFTKLACNKHVILSFWVSFG